MIQVNKGFLNTTKMVSCTKVGNIFSISLMKHQENYLINQNPHTNNPICSIIIPCSNEEGNINPIIQKLKEIDNGYEYIFVEGNSQDKTKEAILKAINENKSLNIKFLKQKGKGKGEAIRLGFDNAKGEILAILDGDLTIDPSVLPKCISLLTENKAEFINCTRMIYPMEKGAMKPLNILANKFFALLISYLSGIKITDVLCGTKVCWKKDYERFKKYRNMFKELDPFGDFDLIIGAANSKLQIVDFPVTYLSRSYGKSNISRFKDGLALLKMCWLVFKTKSHLSRKNNLQNDQLH